MFHSFFFFFFFQYLMSNDFGGTIEQDPILRGEDDFQDELREKNK